MSNHQKISDSLDVHTLGDLQLQALWTLEQLSSGSQDRFTAPAVANHLIEVCCISTSRQAVNYALKKEKSLTHKGKAGYKLMEPGRKKLEEQTQNGKVIFIESGKPFSAKNIALKDIFNTTRNEVFICDPYVDVHTLDLIFRNLDKKRKVKILTKNIIDKPKGSFARHLAELRKEGYQVEIGVYSNSDLHDRYIMDVKTFWLSGNSLNHLGEKESFVVRLGEDIHQSMMAKFKNRWKVSSKL